MSDHEVNIKILLDVLLREGAIANRKERNKILAEMTDEVSELVLADNAQQALALTLDGLRSAARYDGFVDFVEEHDRHRRRQSRRTTTSRRATSCWRIRRRIAAFRVRCCACCSA